MVFSFHQDWKHSTFGGSILHFRRRWMLVQKLNRVLIVSDMHSGRIWAIILKMTFSLSPALCLWVIASITLQSHQHHVHCKWGWRDWCPMCKLYTLTDSYWSLLLHSDSQSLSWARASLRGLSRFDRHALDCWNLNGSGGWLSLSMRNKQNLVNPTSQTLRKKIFFSIIYLFLS